jgi:hypothetical protein
MDAIMDAFAASPSSNGAVASGASGAAAPAAAAVAAATNLSNANIKRRIASFQAGKKPVVDIAAMRATAGLAAAPSKPLTRADANPAAAGGSKKGGARRHRTIKKHRRAARRQTQSRSHH